MAEPREIALDERQIAEIRHSLYYELHCHHGTAGHNQIMLIAGLARAVGFTLDTDNATVQLGPRRKIIVNVPETVPILIADDERSL